MKDAKRQEKEKNILRAAKEVFGQLGFKNAKMDAIAKQAGITKVTLYAYFQSKENLYMAITYVAFQELIDGYYEVMNEYKNKSGLEGILALIKAFMEFCENNFLYSEALLDYFALVRTDVELEREAKLTDAMKESIYYLKLQDIQEIPFKCSAKEMKRGIYDGSIKSKLDSTFLTFYVWSQVIGYSKIVSASGISTTFHHVDISDIKQFTLNVMKSILASEALQPALGENMSSFNQ